MKRKFNSKISKFIIGFFTAFFPTFAFAQFSLNDSIFRGVILEAVSILKLLIPIMIAGAFIVFFWGVTKFIMNSNNAAEVKNGKNYMIWAAIALFALLSFRGIIAFFVEEFGFTNSTVGGVLLLPGNP